MVSIEDFRKLDLRVGKIISAERVTGSDKLIKLSVDLGSPSMDSTSLPRANSGQLSGGSQIIAGIGKSYSPEDLLGKEIVIVVNLEPRKLMGIESNGMILAARDDDRVVVLAPESEVSPGSAVS